MHQHATATEPANADEGPPPGQFAITRHSIMLDGQKLTYQASAGKLQLKDDDGKPLADMFFVAYEKLPAESPSTRPVTFVFNGGPGSSAIWLHIGGIGPMRVDLPPDGIPGPPPYKLVPNEQTWLDVTDLVFIDPVGTGYSTPAPGVDPRQFYSVDGDISTMANFIRLYLTRYQRWLSPRFLAGESYGTTRAAGLSDYLFQRYGIQLNGIVFMSTVFNFETLDFAEGNDLPYELYLPTYTSLAIYHKKLTVADPEKTLADVEHWALTDYATALAKGGDLSPDDQQKIAAQLSAYTTLSPHFILQNHLRITPDRFRKELLNDDALTIGRYDGRLTAPDPDPAGSRAETDPSFDLYVPVYYDCFNDYIRTDLKYVTNVNYEELHPEGWDFGQHGEGYLNVTNSLMMTMLQNPHMRVLFASGYYDLATPFAETDYTAHHLNYTRQLTSRIEQTYYPSGHMLYHVEESRAKLKADVAAFIKSATGDE
ncbi:MAG TPA: hypothetical protein VMD30_00545 [Tepidisphaeraceae bacterium]|nr:hypothetical protein [Tepidisphaeraceae bacterium]